MLAQKDVETYSAELEPLFNVARQLIQRADSSIPEMDTVRMALTIAQDLHMVLEDQTDQALDMYRSEKAELAAE